LAHALLQPSHSLRLWGTAAGAQSASLSVFIAAVDCPTFTMMRFSAVVLRCVLRWPGRMVCLLVRSRRAAVRSAAAGRAVRLVTHRRPRNGAFSWRCTARLPRLILLRPDRQRQVHLGRRQDQASQNQQQQEQQ